MRRNKQSRINVVNAAEYSQGEIDLVWVLGCDHTHRKQRSLVAEAMPQMYAAADVRLLNQMARKHFHTEASGIRSVLPAKLELLF
jgi:hypothetical protein